MKITVRGLRWSFLYAHKSGATWQSSGLMLMRCKVHSRGVMDVRLCPCLGGDVSQSAKRDDARRNKNAVAAPIGDVKNGWDVSPWFPRGSFVALSTLVDLTRRTPRPTACQDQSKEEDARTGTDVPHSRGLLGPSCRVPE